MSTILFVASPDTIAPLRRILSALAAIGHHGSTLESEMEPGEDWRRALSRVATRFDAVALLYCVAGDEAYLQAPAEHLRGMLADRNTPVLIPLVRSGLPLPDAIADVSFLYFEPDEYERLARAVLDVLLRTHSSRHEARSATSPKAQLLPHVVILLHGIRTEAEWQEPLADALSQHGLLVVPIKYQYFDAIRFLLPLSVARARPIRTLEIAYRDLRRQYPLANISVIAHSFGTYCVGQLLRKRFDCKWHRIVLAGSVLRRDFPWHEVAERYDEVVNDCGWRDIWPVLAESCGTGYGASGTLGFGSARVKDRFYRAGHSGLLDPQFAVEYWLPFLKAGEVKPGQPQRPRTPLPLSLLTVLQLKYVVLAFLALLALIAIRIPRSPLSAPPSVVLRDLSAPTPDPFGPTPSPLATPLNARGATEVFTAPTATLPSSAKLAKAKPTVSRRTPTLSPTAVAYPYRDLTMGHDTAAIRLSPTLIIRMRQVERNALSRTVTFRPYYISIDRIPIGAFRLYAQTARATTTEIAPELRNEEPLTAIWMADAIGMTQWFGAEVPTAYQWANAVVAGVVDPGKEANELVLSGRPEGLYTIRAWTTFDNLGFESKGVRFSAHIWPEEVAVARGIGPSRGYLRCAVWRDDMLRTSHPE